MTKEELIKKIISYGQELDKCEGIEAIMIVTEMKATIEDYYKKRVKSSLGTVSCQCRKPWCDNCN